MDVRTLTTAWMAARYPELSPKYIGECTRVMAHDLWPALGSIEAETLTTKQIAAFRRSLKPSIARLNIVVLRSSFDWAIEEGLLDANPARLFKLKGSPARKRFLSDAELKAVWDASLDLGEFTTLFRLLVLTGCRRQELGSLKPAEVHRSELLLKIDPARTKTRTLRLVPLAPTALALIPEPHGRPYLFGKGAQGFRGWHIPLELLRGRLIGMPHFTLHDLRRTMRTGLSRLKVPPHIAELCIGHSKRGMIAVYDQFNFLDEQRDAMNRWAREVHRIVGDSSGVPIPLDAESFVRKHRWVMREARRRGKAIARSRASAET